jgi:uncharacterized protein with gpF-like domain
MLDGRLCEECAALDGGVIPTGDSELPDGMREIDAEPPAHPNCRCTLVPVFDLERLASRVPDKLEEAA